VFCLTKPNRAAIDSFIADQRNKDFSYPGVGQSRQQSPTGYNTDHTRVKLGQGTAVFVLAKRALERWEMFNLGWLQLCWPDAPIVPGTTVAVVVSHLGFWSMNATRIVYVLDDRAPIERYGFAYGTLPGHAEIGEERFTVEFNRDDQSVWYDIYAFSRPRALARLAYPFSRSLQKRFATDSKAAMLRAVQAR
jgi:uncharacterized protein (UPF0548 family)